MGRQLGVFPRHHTADDYSTEPGIYSQTAKAHQIHVNKPIGACQGDYEHEAGN